VIKQWRRENRDAVPEDWQVFTAPWPATGRKKAAGRRDKVTYYQYRADRARRTIRGIDQQIAKAENAVAGKAAVKRNRFVKLTGGTRTINRDLESKARALAGFKAYITNIATPEFVIGAYHSSGASRSPSGCPQTCAPGRSTTTSDQPDHLTFVR
jgi:hypothetical protein